LPQPWSAALEATMFSGWIYDHPEATCRCIESGPSLMLRLSPRRKRKTIALMPTRFAMVCGEIFCRESLRGRHHRPAIAGETLS